MSADNESRAPWVYRAAPVLLALVFLVAGLAKVFSPWDFLISLNGYGVPGALRTPLVLILPTVEVALGVLLLMRWRLKLTGAIAAAFMGVFVVAIGYGWAAGTLEECGCFGPLLERSPRDAMLIDLAFLVLGVVVATGPTQGMRKLTGWRPVALAAVAVLGLGITATQFFNAASGAELARGSAGRDFRSVDLETGEYLLYLFHHECPHCADMSPRVAGYLDERSLPPVVGFTFQTPRSEVEAYTARYGLDIPVRIMQPRQFVRITGDGAVPQLVHMREGGIVRTWKGLLPEPDELRRLLR